MAAQVRNAPDASRYEIHLDGELAGYTAYRDKDGARVFSHTEIFPEFGGKGLGSTLVREALDDVRAAGLSIVALCPFVKKFVVENVDYIDLVDADLDARLRR